MGNKLEVGAGAEDEGADVVAALPCGLPRAKGFVEGVPVVGAAVDEVVGWVPRENKFGAATDDDPVGAEDDGVDCLRKVKTGAVDAAELAGAMDGSAAEELADV